MADKSSEQAVLEGVPKDLYIGGAWRAASGGGTLTVEDPATGKALCEVADAQPDDALAALAAAADKQAEWAAWAPRERGEILRRSYQAIVEQTDELALLMTLEMGKVVKESKAEIGYAAEFFRWFSEEAVRVHGRYMVNTTGVGRILTMRQPVGPCVFVTPWNFPMAMGTRKLAPALAAGCTVVVKPAQQTPLSMLALAKILEQAGLPPGVLNVITAKHSGAVIEPLLKDPRTRKLSFTGSTEVGRKLIEQSAQQVLRVSMELGGNAPFLVFEDADLDAAVQGAMLAKMRNVGEACTAANRFHVHESIAAEFARRLAERMGALKLGRGTEPDTDVGPLIDEAQRGKVEELVGDAR
jgi:succinate-semialdehyde dehydrogenase/glutarate-semialdehyde dehydrogenase